MTARTEPEPSASAQTQTQASPSPRAIGAGPSPPGPAGSGPGCCPVCRGRLTLRPAGLARATGRAYLGCRRCAYWQRVAGGGPDQSAYPRDYHASTAAARSGDARRAVFERLLDRLGPPAGRLLDVGCAEGGFLSLAARRGWQAEGLEPAQAAAAEAAALSGCLVSAAPLELAELGTGRFRVITLINVLDEFVEPAAALARCRGWLEPGGLLYARVPNGRLHRQLMRLAALPAPLGPRFARLTPLHRHVFSPDHLGDLALRAGFSRASFQASPPARGTPAERAARGAAWTVYLLGFAGSCELWARA